MKLYGSDELTYNGSIIFNQDNLTKLSQLENDIKVEGPNGPDTLQMVINLLMSKILELDEAIKKESSLTQLLEDRLATLEEYEDNRILFDK